MSDKKAGERAGVTDRPLLGSHRPATPVISRACGILRVQKFLGLLMQCWVSHGVTEQINGCVERFWKGLRMESQLSYGNLPVSERCELSGSPNPFFRARYYLKICAAKQRKGTSRKPKK